MTFPGQNDKSITMDYKLMCFPCLRKKKKLSSFASSSTDLDDQFEYIVDKYTIRRIPLYKAVTPEEPNRQVEEDEPVPKLNVKDSLLKEKGIGDFRIGIPPVEAYSVPRVTAVMPVTTHSSRNVREKPRPADILDSTSPISRRPVLKPNYVVIPSKASLHVKDIMLTKREITNQYLNNFSSVFVDNLKDQVPKDPENLPRLSRPYTSAVKNLCVGGALPRTARKKDTCRSKVQRLVYSLPDGTVIETGYDSDGVSNNTEDDYPVLVHSSETQKEPVETVSAPFKSSVGGTSSCSDNRPQSAQTPPEANPSIKQITYEDIQALDVGYEFPNSEKYGVKPKMTRIRFTTLDTDRSKDVSRGGYLYSVDPGRSVEPFAVKNSRSHCQGSFLTVKNQNFKNIVENVPGKSLSDKEDHQKKLRYFLTEPCYLTKTNCKRETNDSKKTIVADKFSFTELKGGETSSSSEKLSDSFQMPKPCLKPTARPSSVSSERSGTYTGSSIHQKAMLYHSTTKSKSMCRSRSLESLNSMKKEFNPETLPFLRFSEKRMEEPETETSNSLYSRDSKTSSLITSAVESEPEVDKKATLRWKIIIKHHKDEAKGNGMASK